MKDDERITSNQLIAIMLSVIIGIGILSLPRNVTEKAGPDGWVLILLGGIAVLAVSYLMTRMGALFPAQTVVEYSRTVLSIPLGVLFSLGFFAYFIIFCAFEARVFAEVLKQYLLDKTPTEVIVLTFILVSSYLVRHGISVMGRIAEILVPIIIVPYILFSVFALRHADLTNLLPLMRTPPLKLAIGFLAIVTSYLGFEMVLLFQPFMHRPGDAAKAMSLGVAVVIAFYLLVVVQTVAVFGIAEVQHIIWPSLSLFRMIELPGAFLENVHGVFMAIYVVSIFMTLSGFYLSASLILARVLKLKDHGFLVLPLAPLIYFLAMVPENIPQVYRLLDAFSAYLGVPFGFVLPVVIYIAAVARGFKKGGGDKDEKTSRQRG